MSKTDRGSHRGYLIYFCAICFFVSIISVFLPFFGQFTEKGEPIFFSSVTMLFGGQFTAVRDGATYSYSFSLNLAYILILVFNAAGIVFSLLSRNSPRKIIGVMIIGIFSLIFFLFSRFILLGSNDSMTGYNFAFGIGYYSAIISSSLAILLSLLAYIFCLHYSRRREGFR